MADKFMHIPNDDKQNHPFFRLQLMIETFKLNFRHKPIEIQKKVLKVVLPTNKKIM